MTSSIALFNIDVPEKQSALSDQQTNSNLKSNLNNQQSPVISSLSNSYMSRLNSLHPIVLNGIQEEEASGNLNGEENTHSNLNRRSNPMNDSSLFKEYQKNKLQIVQQLEEQDKKRDELVKQLKCMKIY